MFHTGRGYQEQLYQKQNLIEFIKIQIKKINFGKNIDTDLIRVKPNSRDIEQISISLHGTALIDIGFKNSTAEGYDYIYGNIYYFVSSFDDYKKALLGFNTLIQNISDNPFQKIKWVLSDIEFGLNFLCKAYEHFSLLHKDMIFNLQSKVFHFPSKGNISLQFIQGPDYRMSFDNKTSYAFLGKSDELNKMLKRNYFDNLISNFEINNIFSDSSDVSSPVIYDLKQALDTNSKFTTNKDFLAKLTETINEELKTKEDTLEFILSSLIFKKVRFHYKYYFLQSSDIFYFYDVDNDKFYHSKDRTVLKEIVNNLKQRKE